MLHYVSHRVTNFMAAATKPTSATRNRLSREELRQRIIAAATELVRERSYQELSVGEIMQRAGYERTIFYRHFDDLGDLLLRAGREAFEKLYALELDLSSRGFSRETIRAAMEPAAKVYRRHGPLLRALAEAAEAGNETIAAGQEAMYRRFDSLVASAIGERSGGPAVADPNETARVLNLMNTAYFLDSFGREPRVSVETAVRTVTEIWSAILLGDQGKEGS